MTDTGGGVAGRPGIFITLEGGEGAGKSTQIQRIDDWFSRRGRQVVVTRQPGGTPLAERIRELLLHEPEQPVDDLTELLLMFAARSQFLEQKVRPALAGGAVVVCDRFTDSTYAYQGGGRGVPDDHIRTLETLVHGDLQPDLTLLLDLPVAQGMARAADRSSADRIEREDTAFHQRVRDAYLERARAEAERMVVIDAAPPPDVVWENIERVLRERTGP
jgi:dTMP kinase